MEFKVNGHRLKPYYDYFVEHDVEEEDLQEVPAGGSPGGSRFRHLESGTKSGWKTINQALVGRQPILFTCFYYYRFI